jgi:hypothetical protein
MRRQYVDRTIPVDAIFRDHPVKRRFAGATRRQPEPFKLLYGRECTNASDGSFRQQLMGHDPPIPGRLGRCPDDWSEPVKKSETLPACEMAKPKGQQVFLNEMLPET